MPRSPFQPSLFALGEAELCPESRPRRQWLDAASWIDHWPARIRGADALFAWLAANLAWEQGRRRMYERVVDVPRLTCAVDMNDPATPKVIERLYAGLRARYSPRLRGAFAAYYRDGRDSVAWHADRVDLSRPEHTSAIVSLGGPRKLMLRPKGGGRSRAFVLESGDQLVLGGATQHRWEHGIPKVAHAWPRIALLFFEDDRELSQLSTSSSSRATQASRIET